jgi:microcystin-dependent protein
MNNISFAQPDGFPLEADKTLGSMQADYQTAVRGLAAWFGDMVIVSGLTPSGGAALSEGWIYLGGDLVHFESGAPQATFYIETTVTQKANQNGVLIDRYFVKKARFGTSVLHPQYNYSQLKRAVDVAALKQAVSKLAGLESAVILSGCAVDTVANTITEGVVFMDGNLYVAPAYAGVFPVYLKPDTSVSSGIAYTTSQPSAGVYITFDSHTSQRYADIMRRVTACLGEIKMLTTLSDRFDNTGLGRWELKGWAICNGQNNTIDMKGRTVFGVNVVDSDFNINYNIDRGNKNVTLTIDNMPAHNHTGGSGSVSAGSGGLVKRTTQGQTKTFDSADAIGSGNEPNIVDTPEHIPMQGGSLPFSILPPYRIIVFIQKI